MLYIVYVHYICFNLMTSSWAVDMFSCHIELGKATNIINCNGKRRDIKVHIDCRGNRDIC